MSHTFKGKWITDREFYQLPPRNVFFRQLKREKLDCSEHRNRHILFRKTVSCASFQKALVYISADDYYKLYINGHFVTQGPTPSYHWQYNYNAIDVTAYLKPGRNVIAVHTLYQGLINRTWQSGDQRHGLIMDLEVDGEILACSDETFKTAVHSGYRETGTCGYSTHFLESYDSGAPEVGFEQPQYDDSSWEAARFSQTTDHVLVPQTSHMLTFERIAPVQTQKTENGYIFDFGSNYVGYLEATARGPKGAEVTIRCGQELEEDGTVRYNLRANCVYEEAWFLGEGDSKLDWFDYKSFRYTQLLLPEGTEITDVSLKVQHYPFELKGKLKPEYADMQEIWDICVHTLQYGTQEVIHDCMDRERGFYLGDGSYTSLTLMLLTGDDSMARRLIDDAFASSFITDTLVTCMDCSFMQECAEYPLILVQMVLWHYRITGDLDYLKSNFSKVTKLLNAYSREYEQDGLLRNLDKWCVVEWPKPYRHGYDVYIREGEVCKDAHIAINAYYLYAVELANKMAEILLLPAYRDTAPLHEVFQKTFLNTEKMVFKDGENTEHISLVGNCFVYGFGLYEQPEFLKNFEEMLTQHGIDSLYLFCTFPTLMGLVRHERWDMLRDALLCEGAWKRMLREGATTTFEGWGKETKWNTSLFHLTIAYAAAFMTDADIKHILT